MLFVAAIAVPGFIAALHNRFAALLLYLWFALFRPQDWMWFDVSEWRLSLVVGLVLVVPSIMTGVLPTVMHPISIGSILFFLSACLAQFDSVQPESSWLWLDFFGRLLLVSLLALTLIDTPRRLVAAVAVIAASFGFHSAKAGLASLLGGGLRFSDGLAGAFIDNNGYALGTAMVVFLLIATGQNVRQRWIRWGLFGAVPLSAFTVISTFSRAGFLALGASFLVFAALQRRRIAMGLSLAGLLVLGMFVAPIPEGYAERIATIENYEQVEDVSALGRTHFWKVAVAMAADRPLGVGLRNFEAAYDQYDWTNGRYGHARSVHNSHLEVLAEAGVAGALMYIALFGYAFFLAFRARARARRPSLSPAMQRLFFTMANGFIASMVAFVVGGSFIALALNDLTWLTFALVAALDRLSRLPSSALALAEPA